METQKRKRMFPKTEGKQETVKNLFLLFLLFPFGKKEYENP